MSDPITLAEQLNPDELRRRLDRLDQERAAVIILLRAARARQRVRRPGTREEASHAR